MGAEGVLTMHGSAASEVRDRIVDAVGERGFDAHVLHVRNAGAEATHVWTRDVRRDVHSLAKGVCVLAVGMAAGEGLIDVDAPVAPLLVGARAGAGVEAVTMRHLLTMTSGIDLPWTPTALDDWPDLAHEFLSRPSAGRVFQYSNASTYTAMRVLASVVGDVVAWLNPRLFEPLGIEDPLWDRCPAGWVVGGGGLRLRCAELAQLGLLIRDEGAWAGHPLVSSAWVRAMHDGWVSTGGGPGYDRYALAGWGGPGAAWRLHGAHGQLMVFLDDAVVTITADDHDGADGMAVEIVSSLTSSRSRPA